MKGKAALILHRKDYKRYYTRSCKVIFTSKVSKGACIFAQRPYSFARSFQISLLFTLYYFSLFSLVNRFPTHLGQVTARVTNE